ncbi:MAG: purine-binding chemotaxis protein CheW [Gammaproteobacteria bacterium]|nr:purine-binding chemotaxis protein CheW [Gammaproteobacteria bacterium]
MSTQVQQTPFQLLLAIEQRSKDNAQALPQQIEQRDTWDGVAFRLGEAHLVAPLFEVKEILPCPRLTLVPGAKRWVKGIANIRGSLLPVIDLQDCINGEALTMGRSSRILVASYKGLAAGLLVDEVMGQKHFLAGERLAELPGMGEQAAAFLQGSFREMGDLWGVFSLHDLLESQQFIEIAA